MIVESRSNEHLEAKLWDDNAIGDVASTSVVELEMCHAVLRLTSRTARQLVASDVARLDTGRIVAGHRTMGNDGTLRRAPRKDRRSVRRDEPPTSNLAPRS